MKTRIIRLLFLAGMVATLVTSCYKDNFDSLQKQIDQLKSGEIASVNSQIAAINTSIADLKAVDSALKGYITALQKDGAIYAAQIAELKEMDAEILVKIAELEKYAKDGINGIKDWTNATFATLGQYDQLSQLLASINSKADKLSNDVEQVKEGITADYSKALKAAISTLEQSMRKWINEKLTDYYTIAQVNATLDSLADAHDDADAALLTKINEQKDALIQAKTDLTTAYQTAISTAITTLQGQMNTKIASDIAAASQALQTQIDGIKTEISNIKSRLDDAEAYIEALLNKVQSIVVIPQYTDGSVKLTESGDTICFDISPVNVAEAIANAWKTMTADERDEMVSIKVKGLSTKSGSTPSVTVDTVFFKDGTFRVGVKCVYLPDNASASLHITKGATDVISNYFGLYYDPSYLCFISRENNTDISMGYNEWSATSKAPEVSLQYSTNGFDWNDFAWPGNGAATVINLARTGDRVFFKAKTTNTTFFDWDEWAGNFFTSTKDVDVKGNVMYLLNGSAPSTTIDTPGALMFLFADNDVWEGCPIVDASKLELPATTLSNNCYWGMFVACEKLKKTPALPAMVMKEDCYHCMFCDCIGLENAPALPAMDLAEQCYYGMFDGCHMLKEAPELPATIMKRACYSDMFGSCYSLTSAPELNATVLAELCYSYMFPRCSNLTEVKVLPAVNLEKSCYHQMFLECTALETVPDDMLPATTMAEGCYGSMFSGCSSLKNMPSLPGTQLARGCYAWMFQSCASLNTVKPLGALTMTDYCYNGMFASCTALVTPPAIEATTCAERCFDGMFQNCPNMTSGPDLKAATLAASSNIAMFRNCSKLSSVKILATDISASACLAVWLENAGTDASVTSRTVTVANASMIAGIKAKCPSNWTVVAQ